LEGWKPVTEKKFVVTKKIMPIEDTSVTMTIRIERSMQEHLDRIANNTNRSRNEVINLALKYAIDNAEIDPA
jgi:predicted HicB family RNase H-like nuclease